MKKSIRPDYTGIEKKGVDPWFWWESTGKQKYLRAAKSIVKFEVANKIGKYIREEHQIPDAKYVAALEAYEEMKWKYSNKQLKDNFDKFRDSYGQWWKSSFDALKHTWSGVLDTFSGDITGMATNFGKLPEDVQQYWNGMVDNTAAIGGMLTAGHDFDPGDPDKGGTPKEKYVQSKVVQARAAMKDEKAGDMNMAKQNYVRNKVERISKSKNQPLRVGNHPEWYGKYPELLPNNLNYAVRKENTGFNIAIGAQVNSILVIPQKNSAVSSAYKDAIRAIYIKMRGSNSGAFNYNDEDVAAYIETARYIYSQFFRLHRDIKLVNNLDPYMSQTPYPVLAVAGYTGTVAQDLIQNRANYLIRLNHLSHKIGITLPVPPDMSVFDRDRYIATAIVEEGKGPKSAFFLYTVRAGLAPAGTDINLDSAYIAENLTFGQQLDALEGFINKCYDYTNPIYGGQTFVKIAGDMIKAYGEGSFKALPLITEADKCEMIRDEYLLNQIQNNNCIALTDAFNSTGSNPAYSIGYTCDLDTDLVGTDTIILTSDHVPGAEDNQATLIINRNSGSITNLESVSLTRGNFLHESKNITIGTTASAVKVSDTGTDVIDALRYYYYNGNNVITSIDLHGNASNVFDPTLSEMWAQVDYSPLLPAIPSSNVINYLLDLDTYAFCSPAQFRVMNDAAIMSEYKTVGITAQANFRSIKK